MSKKNYNKMNFDKKISFSKSLCDPDPLGSTVLRISDQESKEKEHNLPKWNREKVKHFQPYNDHKFNRISKIPVNEFAFLGGLGSFKRRKRNVEKIDRPTIVQKIFKMKTGPRNLHTFTENCEELGGLYSKVKDIISFGNKKKLKEIVDKVWMADNFEEPGM